MKILKTIDSVRRFISNTSWIKRSIKELEKSFKEIDKQSKQAIAELNDPKQIDDMAKELQPLLDDLKNIYNQEKVFQKGFSWKDKNGIVKTIIAGPTREGDYGIEWYDNRRCRSYFWQAADIIEDMQK